MNSVIQRIRDIIIKHKYFIALAALIMASFFCQTYQINREFNGFHEYAAAHLTLVARNFLEYGRMEKGLGPICNQNPLNGHYYYYLYHPFLYIFVYAGTFFLFCASPLTTRVTSMFLFSLEGVIIFFLASMIWSKKIALWSAFFYLFFPVSQYFNRLANAVVVPPMLLFVLFYYIWQKENKPRYLYLMLGSFIVGCLAEWYIYFLAPIVIMHYRYAIKNKDNRIFILALVATVLSLGHLAFNLYLTGSISANQSIWPAYLQNSASNGYNIGMLQHLINDRLKFNLLLDNNYYLAVLSNNLLAFTFPVLLMALYFIFNSQKYGYLRSTAVYFFFIPATYFIYGILNPKTLMDHFGLTIFLSGGFAVICALAINDLRKRWQIIFVLLFLTFSFFNIKELYSMNNTRQSDLMLGKIIAASTAPQTGVALSETFFSPLIEYYGHRKILYEVNSWEKLNYAIKSGKINLFITNFKDFQSFLINKYPAIFLPDEYVAFAFKPGTSAQSRSLHRQIRFTNGITLSNWSFTRLSNQYLRLEYDWLVQPQPREIFKVFVHFDDGAGYKFGQDHFIMNGFVPEIKNGQPVRERYIIEIPEKLREKKLTLLIGLYSPITGVRVPPLNISTPDQRVKLGNI